MPRDLTTLPSCKAFFQRVLWTSLLEEGGRRFRFPEGERLPEDLKVHLEAVRALGGTAELNEEQGFLSLRGRGAGPLEGRLELGSNGTLLRFGLGVCAVLGGCLELQGSPQLQRRPLGPLVGLLESLGGRFAFLGRPGHVPLRFEAPGLPATPSSRGAPAGTALVLDSRGGTQGASGLLLGLAARGQGAHIRCTSARGDTHPYLLLTAEALEALGYPPSEERSGALLLPPGGPPPSPREGNEGDIHVPRDPSALAFALVASAIRGRALFLPGLEAPGAHPDYGILGDLEEMGHEVHFSSKGLRFEGKGAGKGDLRIMDLDLRPDSFPPLALLCVFREGSHELGEAPRLRIKESDRIATLAQGFRALGIGVEESEGGLRVRGPWDPGGREAPVLDSRGDHRMAMVFLILGRLGGQRVRVTDETCVQKSWPSFPRFLAGI